MENIIPDIGGFSFSLIGLLKRPDTRLILPDDPGGKAGVKRAIEILKNELSVTMALTGVNKISDIGPQVLVGSEESAPKKKAAARKRKAAPQS